MSFVARHSPGVVRFLLEQGADPDARRLSAEDEWLRQLYENDESKRMLRDEVTPLHVAAAIGAVECTRQLLGADLLVEAGAAIDLETACVAGDTARVVELLDGAPGCLTEPAHRNWRTPLTLAAWQGRADVVRELLARGAPVEELEGRMKNDPLHEAAAGGHVEVLEILLDHGMSVDMRSSFYGRAPIHYAAGSADVATVAFLLDRGASLESRTSFGATPLHSAAGNGNVEVVRFLIARGADPLARDRMGGTPLHDAADAGALECVRLLLDAGAELNARDHRGRTPLYDATHRWPFVEPATDHEAVAAVLRLRGGVW